MCLICRRDGQPHEVVWRTPPRRGSGSGIQRSSKHVEEHCRKQQTSHYVERSDRISAKLHTAVPNLSSYYLAF